MRVERQIVRLRTVTFEKARESLPSVHDLKIARIVDEFLVLVRRRCRRGYELVRNATELVEKCLICLAPKRAQDSRLIKARARECVGADIAIAYTLIVRDHEPSRHRLYFLHVADIDRRVHVEECHRVTHELLFDAQRAHDEHFPALLRVDETAPFELHDRLAKSKRCEYGTPSARRRPEYRVALVRLKYGTYLPRINGNARLFGDHHFRCEKVMIVLHLCLTCFRYIYLHSSVLFPSVLY